MKKFWNNLSSDQKTKYTRVGICVALLLGIYGLYIATGQGQKKLETKKEVKEKVVSLDNDKLEKSVYAQTQLDMKKQQASINDAIDDMKRQLAEFKTGKTAANSKQTQNTEDPGAEKGKENKEVGGYTSPPVPPPPPAMQKNLFEQLPPTPTTGQRPPAAMPPPPPPPPNGQAQPNSQIGGIEIISAGSAQDPKATQEKKKESGLYLPPSFMEGFLLSGVTAPTTFDGKSQPVPMIFRVKNLAILPNSLRANLKGCFVMAEGKGNLASERVETRLLTLSCISKNGESIIDQEIKGYVVDADGQVALKGRPVAKMGMHLARVGMAGLLGGMGKALEESSKDQQFSPVSGVTSTTIDTDPDALAKLGVGAGISSMAKELQNFYLQLAQQTIPVIEVGPTKRVNLVISKGVDLEVMKRNPAKNELTAKAGENSDGATF